MPKTLVLFSSSAGHTAAIADAIAEGASSVRFAEVDVRRLPDVGRGAVDADRQWNADRDASLGSYRVLDGVEQLADYDALILGAPTRDGAIAAELRQLLDEAARLAKGGKLVNKIGSAFTAVADGTGGHEMSLWSIMMPMATFGMILVPPGYADPAVPAGSPYGATAVGVGPPGAGELAAARHQGKRVATVTAMVTHARSHHH